MTDTPKPTINPPKPSALPEGKSTPTGMEYSNLQHHPHASIFPEMNSAEFDLLVEDIRANGVRVPITLYEGKILDGRHRYKAAKKCSDKLTDLIFTTLPPLTSRCFSSR